jgi:hypothetical protein
MGFDGQVGRHGIWDRGIMDVQSSIGDGLQVIVREDVVHSGMVLQQRRRCMQTLDKGEEGLESIQVLCGV